MIESDDLGAGFESAWYDVAERRIAEYESSGEEPMPIEAFLAELRAERR